MKGTIVKLVKERGFGFIRPTASGHPSHQDLFFHASRAADGCDFDQLEEGQLVEFAVMMDFSKGHQVLATGVRPAADELAAARARIAELEAENAKLRQVSSGRARR